MSTKSKLNGSVDLLAKAMRQVFTEAVEEGLVPVREDIKDIRGDIKKLSDGLDTTNQNMQAQFAQHRKDVSADVRQALRRQPSR